MFSQSLKPISLACLAAASLSAQPGPGEAQQMAAANPGSNAPLKTGDKCRVTEGPNKGETGKFGDDGWCEGDWGGTECGEGNSKCEKVAGLRPGTGILGTFDAPPSAVMARSGPPVASPERQFRAVGGIRAAPGGAPSVQLTDRGCAEWTTIPDDEVISMQLLSVPAIVCGEDRYPVARLILSGPPRGAASPDRSGGATVTSLFRLSSAVRLPHLSGGLGLINDADWDRCVDIYLDCQIDTCGEDGGIFGSPEMCEAHCDGVFDGCTFDPF